MNSEILQNATSLSFDEWMLVLTLVGLFGLEFAHARASGSWLQYFRPTLVVAAVLVYYCVLAPIRSIQLGDWLERGQDLRGAFVWGWWGAIAFYASVLVGFHQLRTPAFRNRFVGLSNPERMAGLGRNLCRLALVLYGLVAGPTVFAQLNPFNAKQAIGTAGEGFVLTIGALGNYFIYGVNLLIPGVLLLYVAWLQNRRNLGETLVWLLISFGLFTSLGFRWRLVMIAVPLVLLWSMVRGRRPNFLALASLGAALIVVVSGAIGESRTYGFGISTSALEDESVAGLFDKGIIEGRTVFLTTSGLIERIDQPDEFVGAAPLISVLTIPIPRQLLPDKDTIGYLKRSLLRLYLDPAFAAGAATLNYGEYYLMAGWFSLVAMGVAFGWGIRCLWNWFLLRSGEPLAQVTYILSACFLYVAISRGYMAQVSYLAAFTLGPLYWLYGRLSLPLARFDAASRARLGESTAA